MIGPALAFIGLLLGLAGWLLLRRGGQAWRVGRLLAVARPRSIAEAEAMTSGVEEAYVRIHGRIDSDEEFPGDDGNALVFRRRRLQREVHGWRSGASWSTFDDQRLAVPFRLADHGDRVAVDVEALGGGLVVVPRLSTGVAADLDPELVAGVSPVMAPDQPVRLRIEQVATTDHATVAGVPRRGDDGQTVLGPGLGRPLILTTLELDEAMRVLGSERRGALGIAASLLVAATVFLVVGLGLAVLGR
jgi:hypothetical protein